MLTITFFFCEVQAERGDMCPFHPQQ